MCVVVKTFSAGGHTIVTSREDSVFPALVPADVKSADYRVCKPEPADHRYSPTFLMVHLVAF
jgi:hypothetical protein